MELEVPSESLRIILLPVPGAPPIEDLAAALRREGIDVELAQAQRPGTGLLDRRFVLAWVPADVPDAILSDLVAWRDAGNGTLLLGCSPHGTVALGERALALGFDDFVAGRSSPRELAARLRALARRHRNETAVGSEVWRWGSVSVDTARHEAVVDGRRIPLTILEMTVLRTLIAAQGRVLSREELLDAVWGEDNLDIGLRAVDNLILRLRRKMGAPERIVTVRGVGFRLAE